MDNEKGLTLIEILAALSISSFVLVVMFSLFSSVNQYWNHSVETYNDHANANLVADSIASELSAPTQIYYYSSSKRKEIRYGTFGQHTTYKAIVYDVDQQTLTISYIDDPALVSPRYSSSIRLSEKVTSFDVYLVDQSGSVFGTALSNSVPEQIKQIFQVVVAHQYSRVKVDGSSEFYEKEIKLNIVPINEQG